MLPYSPIRVRGADYGLGWRKHINYQPICTPGLLTHQSIPFLLP